jgi:dienelactone hydrolase
MMTELRLDPATLRPLSLYHSIYENSPRRDSIPATTEPDTWELWRRGLREQIRARLGGFPATRTPLNVQTSTATKQVGYRRELVSFESKPGVVVPAWVLIPDGVDAPAPAVIAIHGHGYGVDDIVGIDADGTDRVEPKGYHKDFAVALCRRGFVVIAPEMLAFGRRRELKDQEAGPEHSSCHDAALWGIMLGQPLLGQRVWDVMRTIDYLETRPEVDPRRIGMMGISGGGTVTLFTASLEDRLQAAVLSGYLCTFKDSILSIDHCLCNYVPGLLEDAEMYDIAALLAPRPLLIEAGTRDDIFPLAAVEDAYARVQEVYTKLGVPDHLDKDIFEGGHQISGAKAYDFLWRWLERA